MKMYLQFGSGMMGHCEHLIQRWGGGTVVLSPRDLEPDQVSRFSSRIRLMEGDVLFDPQFYLPHSDHARLVSHGYWPDDYETSLFWIGLACTRLIVSLRDLNQTIGASEFILPGLFANTIDDDWINAQDCIAAEAATTAQSLSRFATVSVSSAAINDSDQIGTLIEAAERWDVSGYYVVAEPPAGEYLVENPNWLANLLDLLAGLKLQGRKVILGYCNQQMLLASCCKVDAICSGTWMNVRSFSADRFQATEEDDEKRRKRWYYCPHAFSEFKIPFLDIAWRQGVLEGMAPEPAVDGEYASVLFEGDQPTTVEFPDQAAFRHYLYALHEQARQLQHDSFNAAVAMHEQSLTDAQNVLHNLHSIEVKGQNRDFSECVDAGRAALSMLRSTRGPILNHQWASL